MPDAISPYGMKPGITKKDFHPGFSSWIPFPDNPHVITQRIKHGHSSFPAIKKDRLYRDDLTRFHSDCSHY